MIIVVNSPSIVQDKANQIQIMQTEEVAGNKYFSVPHMLYETYKFERLTNGNIYVNIEF